MTLEELSSSTKLSRVSHNSSPSEELHFGDITFDFAHQSVKIGSCSEISEETTREGESLIVEIIKYTSQKQGTQKKKKHDSQEQDDYYKGEQIVTEAKFVPRKEKIPVNIQKFNRAIKTLYAVIQYGEDIDGYQTAKKYLKE